MFQFKVGDEVTWTSQSKGISTTKKGVVIWVVSAGTDAPSVKEICEVEGVEKIALNRIKFDTEGSRFGRGVPRDEDSYVIRVGKNYYRPRTCLLQKG